MTEMTVSRRQAVSRLGMTAREVLAGSRRGRVLAVMSRTVYLEADSNEIVWLTTREAPMHGRGIHLDGSIPRPAVGSGYSVLEGEIAFDEGWAVLWDRAPQWRPPGLPQARLYRGDVLRNTLGPERPADRHRVS
jgi:hypothetical protein